MSRNINNIEHSDYKELLQNPDKQISKMFSEEIAFLKRDKIPRAIITVYRFLRIIWVHLKH